MSSVTSGLGTSILGGGSANAEPTGVSEQDIRDQLSTYSES